VQETLQATAGNGSGNARQKQATLRVSGRKERIMNTSKTPALPGRMRRMGPWLAPAALLLATGTALLALLLAPGAALADCGPGPLIVQNKKGIVLQSLGASTNATFLATQTFAITTGTSGCSNSGIVREERDLQQFAAWNRERIAVALARGGGDSLATLADLLGCDPALAPAFARFAQASYPRLAEERSPVALVAALRTELARDAVLSAGCTRLG
jgi:hypothetical protein